MEVTTGKSGAAVQAIFAVRPLHGNDAFAVPTVRGTEDARQSRGARQSRRKAHGKEDHTAMEQKGARQRNHARQRERKAHGKENICHAFCLCLAPSEISFFSFLFYLF